MCLSVSHTLYLRNPMTYDHTNVHIDDFYREKKIAKSKSKFSQFFVSKSFQNLFRFRFFWGRKT